MGSSLATGSDLTVWLGRSLSGTFGVDRALGRASRMIRTHPMVRYERDDDGDPSDPDDRVVLRDAVCAQVEFWLEIGGGTRIEQSQDILGVLGEQRLGSVVVPAVPELAPDARRVLLDGELWDPSPLSGRFRWGRWY